MFGYMNWPDFEFTPFFLIFFLFFYTTLISPSLRHWFYVFLIVKRPGYPQRISIYLLEGRERYRFNINPVFEGLSNIVFEETSYYHGLCRAFYPVFVIVITESYVTNRFKLTRVELRSHRIDSCLPLAALAVNQDKSVSFANFPTRSSYIFFLLYVSCVSIVSY